MITVRLRRHLKVIDEGSFPRVNFGLQKTKDFQGALLLLLLLLLLLQ